MIQRICFSLCFILTSISFLSSQDYKPTWGPEYKFGGMYSIFSLVGIEGDYYYVLLHPKRSNTLLQYDMDHKLVNSTELDHTYNKKNVNISDIIHTRSGTYGYMYYYDKKEKKQRVFTSKFRDGKFGKLEELYNYDYRTQINISLFGPNFNSDRGELLVSRDSSIVAVTGIGASLDNNQKETMSIGVFNEQMELLWKKKQTFNFKDKNLRLQKTVVDNNGVIYILAKKYQKRMKKSDDDVPGGYKIFRVTKEDMQSYDLDLGEGKIPVDVGIFFPQEDADFILSGFYNDGEKANAIKGVFYASGVAEEGITSKNFNKFDADFMEGLTKKSRIKKDKGLRTTYDIDNFIEYYDGSIGFIAEEYYVTSSTTTTNGRTTTTYTYHSNDLIIPRFSTSGEMISLQKIPKTFRSRSPRNASYTLAVYNSKVYLVFNDYKNREERKDLGVKAKSGWRYTDMVVINADGEIEYNETMFNSKEIELEFVPFLSDYCAGRFLIGSMNARKYAFGLINLD